MLKKLIKVIYDLDKLFLFYLNKFIKKINQKIFKKLIQDLKINDLMIKLSLFVLKFSPN